MSSVVDDVAKEVFTYVNLVHAISGMAGGMSAITVFYPLNIIRMKLQIDDNLKAADPFTVAKVIAKEEGVQALYQGWWSSESHADPWKLVVCGLGVGYGAYFLRPTQVVSLGASNFVYFYTYNAFKSIYKKLIAENPNVTIDPITNLAIASSAGVINVFATTPLWVAGTRLSVQSRKSEDANGPKPYNGVLDCLMRIASEEGIGALWNGVGPSLMLVSNPSIQFSVYDRLRTILEKRGEPITAAQFFVIGAIAKAVATVLTYPIQIAQSRLRADSGRKDGQPRKYLNTMDCLAKIAKDNGVAGWFKGMEAKLWQTVLTAAFQFLTYEQIQKVVFKAFRIDAEGH
ncbi:Peroxisomal membrane protein PMP34 [Hondaea fermentalgiana]|uniref:Peroxisomal membrane protein PMP34 n=1 Tax=Hondaea fermentalgiana TaxID=2315210 RepID=A0A2R5GIX8_9STRA|nr:Peroxisomal membrane protein PMP34 [Hondaea fermentalgiana]|eukprot:GBG30269.1 Peroxisomal membrane protein PMP34 [Hondaea fermentalgiana]